MATTDLDVGITAAGLNASSASDIIRAARALFDAGSFREVTVGAVARAAGVNEVTIYRTFGSKDGLAAACWLGNLEKLRRGAVRDRRETADTIARIERHLRRLARVSIQDRAITLALIQAVEHQTIERGSKIGALDPRKIVPLPTVLAPLVADAQEAGRVTQAFTSFELSAFLTNSVFIRLMTRPHATPTEIADFVTHVVIEGIAPRDG